MTDGQSYVKSTVSAAIKKKNEQPTGVWATLWDREELTGGSSAESWERTWSNLWLRPDGHTGTKKRGL